MNRYNGFAVFLTLLLMLSTVPISCGIERQEGKPTYYHIAQEGGRNITEFSENVLLSTRDLPYAHHVEPTIAVSDNGTLFAGWKNSETHNGGGARVSVAKSVDGGTTWTDPYNIDYFGEEPTRQSDPWLVWYEDTLFYAYLEYSLTDTDFTQMTVARMENYSGGWIPVKASYNDYFADKETMVIAEDGTIYVVYDDADTSSAEGNVTIRVSRSTNGGLTFEEVGVIGWPDPGHLGPYATLNEEGHLFVAWTWVDETYTGNLYIAKSTDMGETFDTPKIINMDGNFSKFTSVDGRPAKSTLPVIRFDQQGRLILLWADTFDPTAHSFDIYMRVSLDEGDTWSERFQVNPQTIGDQWQPDMDIDSEGNLHIVYYDESFEEYRPFYLTATFSDEEDDSPEFSDPISIAEVSTSSTFTRPGDYFTIRLDQNDRPHVVWSDGRNDEMDIFYAHGVFESDIPVPMDQTTLTIIVVVLIASIAVVVIFFVLRRRS
ncbi:MAG: sialidase family protein [Candidatus Thorarchaeota archaeon]